MINIIFHPKNGVEMNYVIVRILCICSPTNLSNTPNRTKNFKDLLLCIKRHLARDVDTTHFPRAAAAQHLQKEQTSKRCNQCLSTSCDIVIKHVGSAQNKCGLELHPTCSINQWDRSKICWLCPGKLHWRNVAYIICRIVNVQNNFYFIVTQNFISLRPWNDQTASHTKTYIILIQVVHFTKSNIYF